MSRDGTTTIVGPAATSIDVAEILDRAGFTERSYSNGGAQARYVLSGGYWPAVEAIAARHGWWVQGPRANPLASRQG